MEFGHYLKSLRKGRFTQKEFATLIGVDHSYISKLENDKAGMPTDLTLFKISKVLTIDPIELLYRAGKLSEDTLQSIRNYPELTEALNLSIYSNTSDTVEENSHNLSTFYQMPIPCVLISLDNMLIEDINISALRLYQYDKEFIKNKPFSILEVNDTETCIKSSSKSNKGVLNANVSYTNHINKIGDLIPVKVITSPVFIKNKLYIMKVIDELDSSCRSDSTPECQAIRCAKVYDNTPFPLFLFSIDDDGTSNSFLHVNQAACDFVGYNKKELLHMNPFDINITNDADIISGLFDVLLIESTAFSSTTVVCKSGERIKCCISARLEKVDTTNFVFVVITETLNDMN